MNPRVRIEVRPLLIGTAAFAIVHVLMLAGASAGVVGAGWLVWLPEAGTVVCAGLAARVISRWSAAQFVILGVLFSAWLRLFNMLWSSFGLPADLSGPSGSALLALFSLPFFVGLSLLGGALGRKRASRAST